jgi:hypothetical protein
MEKAMSINKEILSSVLREAEKPGYETAPCELMTAVLGQSEPILALAGHDQGNIFFEAIRHQFEFIVMVKGTDQRPSAEDMGRWVALMRWFIRELQEWRLTNDPKFHKLTALFVVSMYCDNQDGDFWTALPNGAEQNDDLLCALEKLITRISCEFSVRGSGCEPIWERELVEKFKVADAQEDWPTISELWPSVKYSIIPNVFQVQVVRCLYRFGFESLVQALDGTRQIMLAMQFADSLDVGQRLLLGVRSNNPYIQFGCVYQTFSYKPRMDGLCHEEQQLVTQLLLKVAEDEALWKKWMQVFNRYPLRYPAMQRALGYALAVAPEAAIITYIESINLSTSRDGSRETVAECLRVFRTTASPDRAKAMWKLAYQRWSEWQFELTDKDRHLFEISYSELDFAVVAYAIECMTDVERDAMLNTLSNELHVLDNSWHESLSDCITCWNRILSQFQPYAHAAQVVLLEEDWLMKGKQYLPFDTKSEHYLPMMFQMH